MKRFADSVVLVTGAGSGIGLETALAFGDEGAQVVVSDVNPGAAERAASTIKKAGGRAVGRACDVSDPEQVAALVEGTVKAFGRLDVAFNNAGIEGAQAPLDALAEADWQRVLAVNLSGVFHCMKQELQVMSRQGAGAIVNNASILGTVGFANAGAYVAAKHGVLGLTKTAAIEFAARGIRINAVCPGFIKTPMLERAGITREPAMEAAIAAMHPAHRLGESAEIAKAVLFLASKDASFVNGHPMLVDGGYVAQ
ncbi:MAG: SDR family oxidoreductase [Deltaproteobacteria bacterium]|nr:SDR family oxidoreductase [Deltaproteobacteria bacterium]